MKNTRRIFAVLLVLCAPLVLFARRTPQPAAATTSLAYVGTYTDKSDSKGIYAYRFDSTAGKLTAAGVAAETSNPSFVAVHPNGKFAYAVNESAKSSMVTAFSVDHATGKLTQLNQVSASGEDPCYISFDKTGKYVLIANYTSGNVVVFPILADGKLGDKTADVKNAGELGPNKERQDGPHAHWIEVSPDNRFALVADLGLDSVMLYKFDASKGTLTPNNPPAVKLKAGQGPRHIAFHPNGKFVFVITEIGSTATSFSYDAKNGTLKEISTLSTLPQGYSGRNDVAEVQVHPNGKFLYVSNRGHESIAIFKIDPSTGALIGAGLSPTGGKEPRHFTFDPSGRFLLAENQNSNSIVVFSVDPTTGQLTQTKESVNVPSPVCVTFTSAK